MIRGAHRHYNAPSKVVTPGTVLEERWRIDTPLAMGSMGEVFRGTDLREGTPCAIKVLRPEFVDDGVQVQRFAREARTTLALRHPNIVRVHAWGVWNDRPWIAMELLQGESLEQRLARGPLPPDNVVAVLSQMAAALDAAHDRGVVHRDLKPDNVFVLDTADVTIKVLDFGFAKITDQRAADGLRTAADTLLGTPLYMAPEQIRASRAVDHRADLWSLGVVAYELVVGEAPFQSTKIADLFVEILTAPVLPPSARRPGLPEALDAWVRHALARNPAHRYARAGEMARTFAAALRGEAPPAPGAAAIPPRARAWLPVAVALGVVVVAAAVVLALR